MTKEELRDQLKLNLGISTNRQDSRLLNLIESLILELNNAQGITINLERLDHTMFILDYATYRYSSMTEDMPMHLRFRLHNLYLSEARHVES